MECQSPSGDPPTSLGFDRVCYLACLKGVSMSFQVLFNGIEAVMVLTLIFLK